MRRKAALLLIDMQCDYLKHPTLCPDQTKVVSRAADLLNAFRQRGLPVAHSHTIIRRDSDNRMSHWRRADYWACVAGTDGALPPPSLFPVTSEQVFEKTHYSAFGNPLLLRFIEDVAVNTLVVAGVHTHACIRASVLDAYQAGLEVWVPDDAIASYDPVHAGITRAYLHGKACEFIPAATVLKRLAPSRGNHKGKEGVEERLPAALVNGNWLNGIEETQFVRRDPTNWSEVLSVLPLARDADVSKAAEIAAEHQPAWGMQQRTTRAELLQSWLEQLDRRHGDFTELLVRELGKPLRDARAEMGFARSLLSSTVKSLELDDPFAGAVTPGVHVRRTARGTIAIVTPWNNPVALPVGKIAPALAWGNAAVWKPALHAPRTAMLVMQSLMDAGLPAGLVNMIFGGADAVRQLIASPSVDAVTLTGSGPTGREVAAACALHGKLLQAELGGNNAAIVTANWDPGAAATDLAHAAFSFAGQRCTAVRRVIVTTEAIKRFTPLFVEATQSLRLGLPNDSATQIGPLVSREAQARIAGIVDEARAQGASLLLGGSVPAQFEGGCWYQPTLLEGARPSAPVVRNESFGPIVVLSVATDMEDALRQVNRVDQGLVATLYSDNRSEHQQFSDSAVAGILRFNAAHAPVHPQAPFSGWGTSAMGLPEHGLYDREFYSRVQTHYGPDSLPTDY